MLSNTFKRLAFKNIQGKRAFSTAGRTWIDQDRGLSYETRNLEAPDARDRSFLS